MSKKTPTSILITDENRQYLKDNQYKNNESYTSCINRLLDKERKSKEKENK